ncbi:MAG: hypothetical protein QXY49_06075 [Thermofilaceae archaeon]
MPSPVISHLIGTLTMLGVALLILSAFSFTYFTAYMQSVNLMLAETAESVAREIVELVSVQTLGGGEYTYMYLTVPDALGRQPYSVRLQELSENKLLVNASLQIYYQVRVVVTPNFGQNPVHAVRGVVTVAGIQVSDTILLPLPLGYKPAIVAFREGEYIYVGFTAVRRES